MRFDKATMFRLRLRLDGNALRLWHVRLCERLLERHELKLSIDIAPSRWRSRRNVDALFWMENIIFGNEAPSLSHRVGADALTKFSTNQPAPPALVLDLTGDVASSENPVWRVECDGLPGEAGLLAAIRKGRAPVVTITNKNEPIIAARLGTEARTGLGVFEDHLARLITTILAALDGAGSATLPSVSDQSDRAGEFGRLTALDVVAIVARDMARASLERLYRLVFHRPHWRIGWRKLAGSGLADLRRHPKEGWRDIPDDRRRFFADPFPLERGGQVTLFVEEFDHARRKGKISAVTFGPEGPVGGFKPVLERPYHLSYPFVFTEDGESWMIPESCSNGTIDLYRASNFPNAWVHETTLVDNVVASDATLVKYEDRWWMFATVRDGAGSYSDSLHIWFAQTIRGPWTPHQGNPVLIDIASARPAGRMLTRAGRLLRPFQDCRKGYGTSLGIARITCLTVTRFEQTIETTVAAGRSWPGTKLHTLNEAGGLEFIDGSRHARRRFSNPFGWLATLPD